MEFAKCLGLAAASLALFLQGCNGETAEQQLPAGAKVEISPNEINWEISPSLTPEGECLRSEDFYNDTTLQITVMSAENVPLGGIRVQILADLSEQTFPGFPWLKLYEDRNDNGVADPDEYVSDGASKTFVTYTDAYHGTARVIVRANLSCPYRGNLYVYASSATGSINVDVQAREELIE